MYDRFFGLGKGPFNLTPDPECVFLTPQHREALVGITYAILRRKGFVVLTGEAGTGKTTLLARALQTMPPSRLQFGVILNPTLNTAEFLEMALLDFGISDIPTSKARRLWKLQNLLLEGQQQGKISALIVDEAHKLGPDVLEEIRLLGNFEAADHKLLQILLVGQTELEDNLERQDLRQLKQRIALWLRLSPLGSTEVGEYIRYRWAAAGGKEPPFSTEAIDCVALASRNIPRVINNLCETALTLALGEGNAEVKGRHVLAAADEMKIGIKRDVTEPTPAPSVDPEVVAEAPLEQYHNGRPTGWAKWAERLRLSARHETA